MLKRVLWWLDILGPLLLVALSIIAGSVAGFISLLFLLVVASLTWSAPAPSPRVQITHGIWCCTWDNAPHYMYLKQSGECYTLTRRPDVNYEWEGTWTYDGRIRLLTVRERMANSNTRFYEWSVTLDESGSGVTKGEFPNFAFHIHRWCK